MTITQHNHRPQTDLWSKIWRCPITQRARVFPWSLGHDCIMTENMRKRRNLTHDNLPSLWLCKKDWQRWVIQAELSGILWALHVAWDKGYKKVIIEIDFADAINLIMDKDIESHYLGSLINNQMLYWQGLACDTYSQGREPGGRFLSQVGL
ncbi:hypothetical protein G2W53_021893 [Senna tora]|uniref:RNase H type-1 domain-containing protein n=1 Tax=Senna tora TaxID=362788 RepID=A0A834TM28_9FABA|nr:hypothetical protein G2W53_021893 [Senna tora]